MQQFDDLRARILALFPGLIAQARRAAAAETEQRLLDAERELTQARLAVVVCGEFKRGKSSLLNALLEEPGLFPVDDYYATSLVSTISHGAAEEITVVLAGQGGQGETRAIGRADIAGYVTETGNRDNRKGVELVRITTPNPRLASGLTFVDTPGVGGIYVRHTMVTLGFLPLAHAVLFVADATQVLTESELHFLRRAAAAAKVTDDADGLICVLTKVDLVGDYGRLLENTRAKLAEVMSRPPEQVTVIPVSAKAKLRYLARGDERHLRASNFAELDRVIWATLARRQAKVVLGSALAELERGAQSLLTPIESELESLRARTAQAQEKLRAAQAARRSRLAELDDKSPGWRRDLTSQLDDLAGAVQKEARSELDDVWDRFRRDYLHRDDFLRDPDKMISRLDEDAVAVAGTASKLLSKRAARLQRDFAAQVGLDLGHARIGSLPDPPVSRLRVSGRLEDGPSGAPAGGGVRTGAVVTAGAVAGAALGTILLPGVGTVIGGVIGGLAGFFGRRRGGGGSGGGGSATAAPAPPRQDVKALRRSLEAQIAPLEKTHRQHVSAAVQEVAAEFSTAVLAELDSRIVQERESLASAVRRAEQATQHTAENARAREQELARERVPADQARAAVDVLAVAVGELAAAPGAAAPETSTAAAAQEGAQ
jgi:hypothetical protein